MRANIRVLSFLLAFGWPILLGAGASYSQESGEANITETITGEAFYRERKVLPPGAELQVTLEDVSMADVASIILSRFSKTLTGAPPYRFTLDYFPSDIDPRRQYSLRAKILIDSTLLFTSTQRIDPFRQPDDAVMIQLTMVGHPKSQQLPEPAPEGGAAKPPAELSNTYWKLSSLNESQVSMAEQQEREIFLQLQDETKRVRGFAGCNTFSGNFRSSGRGLSIGPLAVSRRACPAGMSTEVELLRALEANVYQSIRADTLVLMDDREKPIARFVAVYLY